MENQMPIRKECEILLGFVHNQRVQRKGLQHSFIVKHYATDPSTNHNDQSHACESYVSSISPKITGDISSLSRFYRILCSICVLGMSQLPAFDPLKSGTWNPAFKIIKADQSKSFAECMRIGVEYTERLERKLRKQIANFDGSLVFHSNVSDMDWLERANRNGTIFAFNLKHVLETFRRTFNHETNLLRVNMIYYDNKRFGDSFVLNSYDMESKSEDLHVTLNGGIDVFVLISFIIHKHRIAPEDGVVTNRLFLYTKGVGNWDQCIYVFLLQQFVSLVCPSLEISVKFFKKSSKRSIEFDRSEDCSKLKKLVIITSYRVS